MRSSHAAGRRGPVLDDRAGPGSVDAAPVLAGVPRAAASATASLTEATGVTWAGAPRTPGAPAPRHRRTAPALRGRVQLIDARAQTVESETPHLRTRRRGWRRRRRAHGLRLIPCMRTL